MLTKKTNNQHNKYINLEREDKKTDESDEKLAEQFTKKKLAELKGITIVYYQNIITW